MKTRPHIIRTAALILTISSLGSALFPRCEPQVPSSVEQNDRGARVERLASVSLPLSFEVNRGQADADVKFVGRGDGFGLLLKPAEAVLTLRKPRPALAVNPPEAFTSHQLSMKLEGAASKPSVTGVDRQIARANYFIGNDPAKWIRGVETYSGVLYSGVYPGVDLAFYANHQKLEYDFTMAPYADPQEIRLRFEGADDVELGAGGALILRTAAGDVKHDRPVAYQEANGSRLPVLAAFKEFTDGTIGFQVGDYDRTRPLVIDPVLVYSSYLGGAATDSCKGLIIDKSGNAFLAGDSFSSNFLSHATTTNSDIFLGKLNKNGLLLTYAFFGGSKNDSTTGLALDPTGNIYVSGVTESSNFPVFNSFASALVGVSDAFVVKLTPSGEQFFYSNLLGGSGQESGVSVAADATGNAYVTGRTTSADFPLVAAIQPTYGGGDSDAFITKIAQDGKSVIYSSFLGGGSAENPNVRTGISVDAFGNAYVTGETQSANFPTKNALRAAKTGAASSLDGFVTKINPSGSDFVYSTYLGGSEDDSAFAVTSDTSGNAYVTGRTKSPSFTGSASTRVVNGTNDFFAAKLNSSGSAISYLTFFGGALGDESGNAIVLDASGNAVIAGSAGDGLTTVQAVQSYFRGGATDAFVAKLSSAGAVTFSTYIGGSGDEVAEAVGVDSDGAILITGSTDSTDLLTFVSLRPANAGGRDIFFARFDPNTTPIGPVFLQAAISGKNLLLYGQGFGAGAVLRVNDEPTKTRNFEPDPTQELIAKRAYKNISAGQTVQLQIQNADGKRSNFLFLSRPQ